MRSIIRGMACRFIVRGVLQRHNPKLRPMPPVIDRARGVFDREHIVDAVRGKGKTRGGSLTLPGNT